MKKRPPEPSPAPLQRLGRWLLTGLSYVALAGAIVSLAWMDRQLATLPPVALSPWDGRLPPLVLLDAGHGGHDGGAVAGEVLEKNLALHLTGLLRDRLRADGLRVRMTRETDVFVPLEARAAEADRLGADLLVSLHLNTGANPEAQGVETYFSERRPLMARRLGLAESVVAASDPRRRQLAETLQREVCAATGAVDRQARERGYVVVGLSACPAALVECGFLTCPEERARLLDPGYQERLVDGLARGVNAFLLAQPDRSLQAAVP